MFIQFQQDNSIRENKILNRMMKCTPKDLKSYLQQIKQQEKKFLQLTQKPFQSQRTPAKLIIDNRKEEEELQQKALNEETQSILTFKNEFQIQKQYQEDIAAAQLLSSNETKIKKKSAFRMERVNNSSDNGILKKSKKDLKIEDFCIEDFKQIGAPLSMPIPKSEIVKQKNQMSENSESYSQLKQQKKQLLLSNNSRRQKHNSDCFSNCNSNHSPKQAFNFSQYESTGFSGSTFFQSQQHFQKQIFNNNSLQNLQQQQQQQQQQQSSTLCTSNPNLVQFSQLISDTQRDLIGNSPQNSPLIYKKQTTFLQKSKNIPEKLQKSCEEELQQQKYSLKKIENWKKQQQTINQQEKIDLTQHQETIVKHKKSALSVNTFPSPTSSCNINNNNNNMARLDLQQSGTNPDFFSSFSNSKKQSKNKMRLQQQQQKQQLDDMNSSQSSSQISKISGSDLKILKKIKMPKVVKQKCIQTEQNMQGKGELEQEGEEQSEITKNLRQKFDKQSKIWYNNCTQRSYSNADQKEKLQFQINLLRKTQSFYFKNAGKFKIQEQQKGLNRKSEKQKSINQHQTPFDSQEQSDASEYEDFIEEQEITQTKDNGMDQRRHGEQLNLVKFQMSQNFNKELKKIEKLQEIAQMNTFKSMKSGQLQPQNQQKQVQFMDFLQKHKEKLLKQSEEQLANFTDCFRDSVSIVKVKNNPKYRMSMALQQKDQEFQANLKQQEECNQQKVLKNAEKVSQLSNIEGNKQTKPLITKDDIKFHKEFNQENLKLVARTERYKKIHKQFVGYTQYCDTQEKFKQLVANEERNLEKLRENAKKDGKIFYENELMEQAKSNVLIIQKQPDQYQFNYGALREFQNWIHKARVYKLSEKDQLTSDYLMM